MKKSFLFLSLLVTLSVIAQTEQLAQNYFDKADFEKAIPLYEEIITKNQGNSFYIQQLSTCYVKTAQFDKAESLLTNAIKKNRNPTNYIDLGYVYQLQKNTSKAEQYYQLALQSISENVSHVYGVAQRFEQKVLLNWALEAYNLAYKKNPNLNFDYQIALLEGQMGNLQSMIDKLLDFALAQPNSLPLIQSQFMLFINTDSETDFVPLLKKSLLIRTQKDQSIFWNEFLSWLYVQQKEYDKAFIQQKAIFKRQPDNVPTLMQLAKSASTEGKTETASAIFNFVIQNVPDATLQIEAHTYLLQYQIAKAKPDEYSAISKQIENLLATYGNTPLTLGIILQQAHFDAFYQNKTAQAINNLSQIPQTNLSPVQKASVKMELANIYRFTEKFNQAILLFAQVEDEQKNSETGQQAQFEMARTSYFKNDFEWAIQQTKVLKSATSQLIANDALDLYLLITDNIQEDSLKVALTKFAKADFLKFQNKTHQALQAFLPILSEHKGEAIEDDVLYRMAQLYTQTQQYTLANTYYEQLLTTLPESIYTDEALYYNAILLNEQLAQPEKAKQYFEKIVLQHPDSLYFVEAQQQYRKARGN